MKGLLDKLKWLRSYADPGFFIGLEAGGHKIGVFVLLFLAFAEAGLFTGLFFSSDSLLFIAGMYSSGLARQLVGSQSEETSVAVLAGAVASASIVGNCVSYWYGSRAAAYFRRKPDGFFYKRKYLKQSQRFFDKYGVWAIVGAHYLPLVRTFIPSLAAVSGMRFARFATFITVSSAIWAFSILSLSHYGYEFLLVQYGFDLKEHLWIAALVLLLLLSFYLATDFIRSRLMRRRM